MTQSEESEFVKYSSGLMAAESVVNIDPRHMKDVVMSGHLPIKAMIVPWPPEGLPIPIPCQFNPNEITYDVGAKYKDVFGDKLEPGLKEYAGTEHEKLTMKLDFDTSESGYLDVRIMMLPLLDLVKVNPIYKLIRKAMGAKVRPPYVYFIWGMFSLIPLMTFKAVVKDLSVVFTYFSPEGVPLRASVTVVFQAVLNEFLGQNPTSRSEARKMRVVAEGETLDYIAHQEYGDSARWRHIALVNDIDNPMAVRAGTVLKLTPIDGAGPL